MIIKKGNAVDIKMELKSSTGSPIDDLASTTGIIFVVKTAKTDADGSALISKAKTDMTIDDPNTGNIIIPLTSTDTNITVGTYSYGLQLVYSATRQIEIDITDDSFTVTQDTVRG